MPEIPIIQLGDDRRKLDMSNMVGRLWDQFPRRPVEAITGIALHHDAAFFPEGDRNFNGTTEDEELARILAVHRYHTQTNKWAGIAYHIYCFPSGRLWHVGDLLTVRAHVAHRNTALVGIVGAGDFSRIMPSWGLILAYANAIDAVNRQLRRPLPYKGHREWAVPGWETACPGDPFRGWIGLPAVIIDAVAKVVNK